MTRVIPFEDLPTADLIVDAVYESSADGQIGGEAVSRLLPGTGNMGGFRVSGRVDNRNWVALFTTGKDPDWPDALDARNGKFIYFGDNKTPGRELHDTNKGGNNILRFTFEQLHLPHKSREDMAPFFVFEKSPTATGKRSVKFKGLAAPGYPGLAETEDLIAIWKTKDEQRFQNYRAVFTILDVSVVPRRWLEDLASQQRISRNTPDAWLRWARDGEYLPLTGK